MIKYISLVLLFYLQFLTASSLGQYYYMYGIMDVSPTKSLNESSKDKIEICVTYPSVFYLPEVPKTYKLKNSSDPVICDSKINDGLQQMDKPEKDSLLLVSANSSCNITNFIDSLENSYDGVVVISNDTKNIKLSSNLSLEVFAIMSNNSYTKIENLTTEDRTLYVQIYHPADSNFEPSVLFLWLIAFSCIIIGSIISKVKGLQGSLPIAGSGVDDEFTANNKYDLKINAYLILFVVCSITTTLLLLYFFYNILVYFFMAIFGLATTKALYDLSSDGLSLICMPLDNSRVPKLYGIGIHRIFWLLACLSIPTVWFVFRHYSFSWILQDILGYAFCLQMIRTFRIPTLRLCSILLWFLFVYDIFFVYITPYFTSDGQSIMVEVATGGGKSKETLPLLFKLPHMGYDSLKICNSASFIGYSLLGFGDVIVPGFLVAFTFSADISLRKKRGAPMIYFITSVIGYGVGLVAAFVVLFISKSGQPALLYIVPATLIPIYIVAFFKGQFGALWNGVLVPTTS